MKENWYSGYLKMSQSSTWVQPFRLGAGIPVFDKNPVKFADFIDFPAFQFSSFTHESNVHI